MRTVAVDHDGAVHVTGDCVPSAEESSKEPGSALQHSTLRRED